MKSKIIIKLNENDNYLSLGNIFRLIKEISIDPNSFLQTDLFSIIFNCEPIANSTVNNYCTGQRAINPKYKNYMLIKKNEYKTNSLAFRENLSKILTLMNDGTLSFNIYSIEEINQDKKLKQICTKLYSISKNDVDVNINLSNKLFDYLNTNDLYSFFVEVLLFSVLDRVQPVYKNNVLSDLIEKNIANTNISVNQIEKYVQIQLKEGIWSLREIYELAKQNNPFACFEIASLEFYGIISGCPRYDIAYQYYKIADKNNHPVASWAIGFMYYNGYIGSKSSEELKLAYNYFIKSAELNCPSAFNSLGLVYMNGDIPNIKKNIKTAIKYFKQGSERGNVYAFNNLGKIAENDNELEKAFNYYKISANLGDSWALNKVGEFYRLGIGTSKNLQEAFNYYEKASNCLRFSLCAWSKYNLAKYFYKNGVPEININSNLELAIKLLNEISDELIEAIEELIYIYYELYLSSKEEKQIYLNKIQFYLLKIEQHPSYNTEIKNRIENNIKLLYSSNIDISKYLI